MAAGHAGGLERDARPAQWRIKKIGRASDSLNQAGQALEVWTADEIRIDALLKLTASTSLAKAAASLFHGEATQPTLTPVALEQVAGDVRAALQQTIEQWRKALPGEDARQVIESLRDLGLQVQRSAASLIAAKPPIVTRKVESAANLRQLAICGTATAAAPPSCCV